MNGNKLKKGFLVKLLKYPNKILTIKLNSDKFDLDSGQQLANPD